MSERGRKGVTWREEIIGDARLILGDCREVLPTLSGVDCVVTDPPYHLTSTNRGSTPGSVAASRDVFKRVKSGGFMGKQWDGGDIAFRPETWRLVFDAMKPGAHLAAFGGTRTFHRMACAIEDAGFEIRDMLMWVYASGFPKSHDVSKGIDKAAGAVREVVGRHPSPAGNAPGGNAFNMSVNGMAAEAFITAPATPEAAAWSGWGTALKPAVEPIVLARKPLVGTVAANVLKHGTGAINIDRCRVATDNDLSRPFGSGGIGADQLNAIPRGTVTGVGQTGRWPANLCHDGSDEVLALFPETASGSRSGEYANGTFSSGTVTRDLIGDTGSAARFFYTAKADKEDRAGSKHPTVKPRALMRWLVRLITPPGGTVLDCFAGTGSTLQAALAEGFKAIGIERDEAYAADIKRRLLRVSGEDAPLFQAADPQDARVADLFAEREP